jgi:hypothetical protein
MSRFVVSAALLPLFCLSAARAEENAIPEDVLTALTDAETFELYSLNPNRLGEEPEDGDFHGWKVLGKTQVKDAEARESLINALKKGVSDSDGTVAACFNPRHGIQVTTADGKTVSVVICFECLSMNFYKGGERSGYALTTQGPQETFNKVLTDAEVPLAAPAEE